MNTRHNPQSAKITSSHFDYPGARDPEFDQDGNVIYRPTDATQVDRWLSNLHRNTPRQADALRVKGLTEPLHERRDAEAGMIGRWWRRYGQRLARDRGTRYAAQRLRKYGVPLHVALLVLT